MYFKTLRTSISNKKQLWFLFACILTVVTLQGCGGGGGDTIGPQNPLALAPTTNDEPVGRLAVVKALALKASVAPDIVDATALFEWAEIKFPDLFVKGSLNQEAGPYIFRYYPSNNLYLAVEGEIVLALGPITNNKVLTLGRLVDFTCSVFPEVCLPPLALAGVDRSVKAGSLVELDGTSSSDPSGDPLAYRWSVLSKPSGSLTFLSSTTNAKPNLVPDLEGVYVVKLVVNDGRSDSAPVLVTVTAAKSNAIPVAVAGLERTVSTGSAVTLDGAASSDADADLLTYKWSFISRPINSSAVLTGANSSKPIFVADVSGVFKVNLIVRDGKVESTPSVITVNAIVENVAPVANPGNSQSVASGSYAFLNGLSSYDPNGDSISYLWTLDSRPSGSTALLSSAATSNAYFKADMAGSYVVSLTVTDGKLSSKKSLTINASGISTVVTSSCCKVCTTGKPCGNSCISRTYSCSAGVGCAC